MAINYDFFLYHNVKKRKKIEQMLGTKIYNVVCDCSLVIKITLSWTSTDYLSPKRLGLKDLL